MSLSIDARQCSTALGEPSWCPRFVGLADWLRWQQTLHPNEMELGLDRVRQVFANMELSRPAPLVITVAGTNGKGSSVAMLEAILSAAGYRVGCYTSPHLIHYNERIRICGKPVGDEALCRAFSTIDCARGDTSLTFFEFGTLAAFWTFERHDLDVVILEVGLGGRLDAVNLIDADAVLVTSIGIDHSEWLGSDRETIALEKAGVIRAERGAVIADPMPPRSLLRQAHAIGARPYVRDQDFGYRNGSHKWNWWSKAQGSIELPLPGLQGAHQLDNASGVLALLRLSGLPVAVPDSAIVEGLVSAQLAGRFTRIPGRVERVYDVAHNPDGVRCLAANLAAAPGRGANLGVVGMLKDKPAAEMFAILGPLIDRWYLASLDGSRGRCSGDLETQLRAAGVAAPAELFASVTGADAAASDFAAEGDRIVCFGSFRTVAACLERSGN